MFSKHRHSRGPEQPVNTGAVAAASAIGRAITNNGRSVDHSKLPTYNNMPTEIKRSSSMMGSRRNSLLRGPSIGSRNNSLNSVSSSSSNSSHSNRPKSTSSNASHSRAHSLQAQRRPPSRNNSVTSRGKESHSDTQRAFHEFGGLQASGVIHKPMDGPKMVKRYVPSANGLITIEVPVEESAAAQSRSSSLRRSASTNGLSVSRNSSLTRRKSIQAPQKNPQKRYSSLTESSSSSTKLHSASSKTTTKSPKLTQHPLIETYVEEETEQELNQEDLVRPIKISAMLEAKPNLNESRVAGTAESKKLLEKIDDGLKTGPNTVVGDEQKKGIVVPPQLPQEDKKQSLKKISVNAEENTSTGKDVLLEKEEIDTQIEIKEKVEPVTNDTEKEAETNVESREDMLPEINHTDTSDTQFYDSQDVIRQTPTNDISDSKSLTYAQSTGGTSLAQHLRAANPYLNQHGPQTVDGKIADHENETTKSSTDNLRVGDKNLYKIPSPMKSALKKSSTRSSNTSSVYSEYSPANDAYLSLTTAENTRLNAKLANAEAPSYKSRHPARPQSMVNSNVNRSSSPTPRESKSSRRNSIGPQQKVANKTLGLKQSNDSNIALDAAKVSASANRSKNASNSKVKSLRNGMEEQAKKKSLPDKRNSTVNNSALYPRELPQKKSSFEKLRNQESSHLGFKKLSLRDAEIADPVYEPGFKGTYPRNNLPSTPNKQSNDGTLNLHDASQSFLQNSGWKSRIHDSDSDEDGGVFSSAGTSRSTQSTSNGNQFENSSGGSGFSLFKNKNKPQQTHEVDIDLAPPQPRYLENTLTKQKSVSDSANSTPNKINKKWSKMSLRSSSTGDMEEQPSLEPPKNNSAQMRFHSQSNTGNEKDVLKSKTLRATVNGTETPTKKKNAFGKKLKKLFGRKP